MTCWLLFFTVNKTIIKQVTRDCYRKIRKCIFVPDGTPQATSPTLPSLLEHIHVRMCGNMQHAYLSSASRELQPSRSLWPHHGWPCPVRPGWLGTGFHCPGGGDLPALVRPSTTFPCLWVAGLGPGGGGLARRAGEEIYSVGPHALELESRTAKPSPGIEQQRLA